MFSSKLRKIERSIDYKNKNDQSNPLPIKSKKKKKKKKIGSAVFFKTQKNKKEQ